MPGTSAIHTRLGMNSGMKNESLNKYRQRTAREHGGNVVRLIGKVLAKIGADLFSLRTFEAGYVIVSSDLVRGHP